MVDSSSMVGSGIGKAVPEVPGGTFLFSITYTHTHTHTHTTTTTTTTQPTTTTRRTTTTLSSSYRRSSYRDGWKILLTHNNEHSSQNQPASVWCGDGAACCMLGWLLWWYMFAKKNPAISQYKGILNR
uniref:Uncharacterized protein n=1 Tax=Onchocerca volvulus TaxID=6282 RepID=A0A8R1XSL7_ONCVO